MCSRTALAVMARYPIAGTVKTRLAAAIGAQRACNLYRAFLRDIGARFGGGPRELVWVFHPPHADFAAVATPAARCLPQRGRNLGERMHNCFRELFADGFANVIMIGADVPHVRETWLNEADEHLNEVDVVLGPSADGGYYLVAMRSPHDVFSGIEMSTNRVLSDTLRKTAALGLQVRLLPETFDVDDERDLLRLRSLLEEEESCHLPHTAAVLAEWEGESAESAPHETGEDQ
ncbi:MAG: TIGR04282 family arsenosugar biosynthesis glycosyltransferase [Candidatus Binatia bacterium]